MYIVAQYIIYVTLMKAPYELKNVYFTIESHLQRYKSHLAGDGVVMFSYVLPDFVSTVGFSISDRGMLKYLNYESEFTYFFQQL